MSYGQFVWQAQSTWILYQDFSRGHAIHQACFGDYVKGDLAVEPLLCFDFGNLIPAVKTDPSHFPSLSARHLLLVGS